jgi:hypothetical protein
MNSCAGSPPFQDDAVQQAKACAVLPAQDERGKRAVTHADFINRLEQHNAIRTLLQRCLTKNPANRLHDIADARIELQDDATTPR